MRLDFSTSDVERNESFDYWREAVCDAYVRLGCESPRRAGFRGSIALDRLSSLSLSQVAGHAHSVERRLRDIARDEDAYFLVSLQRQASCQVTQHQRTVRLDPGDFTLYSSIEPYRLTLENDFRQLVVQIPRGELLMKLPDADLLTGYRISGSHGVGALVSRSIVQFGEHIVDTSDAVQQHMQQTLIDLVATGLSGLTGTAPESAVAAQQLLFRAKHYIEAHVSEPTLDRTNVALAMNMSVRRLNEVFAKEGSSIAAYIRDTRLQRIADDLLDSRRNNMSISEIAMRLGANNLQHFSRLFRKRFGMSAREYRKRGQSAKGSREGS